MNLEGIKNIVFDLGGVLIDLDPDKTYTEITKLLGTELSSSEFIQENKELLKNYETGKLNTETFFWKIQKQGKNVPDPNMLIKAWNAMLLGWQPEKFDILTKLRNKYRTFLLSNTNDIHLQWVRADLGINHGFSDFENHLFNKAYYSHMIGEIKPNTAIFNYVLNDARIKPEQTLFIDDIEENTVAAKALGFHTILHKRNESINYLLQA